MIAHRTVHLASRQTLSADASDQDFLGYARSIARQSPCVVLLSGGEHDSSRYSIAAWSPFAVFRSRGSHIEIQAGDDRSTANGSPLELLDELLGSFHPDFPLVVEPFSGGAMGYVAYDLKNMIERLPQAAQDDLGLPDLLVFWPRNILVHDRSDRKVEALVIEYEADPLEAVDLPIPEARSDVTGTRAGELGSNFTHKAYLDAVERVREYIRNGDVYQVNLSQRFAFSFEGDPFGLWESLNDLNPAPFYAFVQAGDHQVLCTSMERFLLRRGSRIETRPIKGTRPRGDTPEEDAALAAELSSSEKDDAELSMIVDLLRNDLGRVCQARSVRVAEHKRLEAYQNVYHLVSIVRGDLRPDVTDGGILRATFPGGSITGCPKIRSMEIIDELEPKVRHVYTGSIGYFGWHQNMDLNIAIRTALVHQGRCYLSVGGGIVYDSEPEAEYQETLHKGRTFFQVIGALMRNP